MKILSALLATGITFVNPWIGTGGVIYNSGMTFPGATTPFGWVRLGPDTQFGTWPARVLNSANTATAGYYRAHRRIRGFSHTRMEGAGLKEGGAFRVFSSTSPVSEKVRNKGLKFKPENEKAFPGFYEVTLPKEGLKVELTASARCGVHRYSSNSSLSLFVDPLSSLSDKKMDAPSIEVSGDVLTGYVKYKGDFSNRYGGLPLYFYAKFSQIPVSTKKENAGIWLNWSGNSSDTVVLKLCISAVSEENARLNYEEEVSRYSFEEVRQRAEEKWEQWLSRIQVQTESLNTKKVFYSALYRSASMPTVFQDVNHEYLGFDGKPRKSEDFTYYTDLSLWDTFRTVHPLYTLVAPEVQRSVLLSLIEMAKLNHGLFPLWPAGAGDGKSMFGFPSHFLFAESWAKGLRDFDPREVLGFMENAALLQSSPCNDYSYCPSGKVSSSVSQTLERSWANGVSASFAQSLGVDTVAERFLKKSYDYRELWDQKGKFFAPRTEDGVFLSYRPSLFSFVDFFKRNHGAYTEGSPHHWRYSVPQNVPDLIALFGGDEEFTNELDRFMRKGARQSGDTITPSAYYWHGNEHDLHAIYLFNDAHHPELTQKWARWALETRYSDSPGGLAGNDDGGALSAWYVLSALGIYPQAGTSKYWLGSPAIQSASLDLGQGKKLTVIARENSARNIYVQSVKLNGVRLCEPSIDHRNLVDATLEFQMGNRPAPLGGYSCAGSSDRKTSLVHSE